jgi:hypothetical protein
MRRLPVILGAMLVSAIPALAQDAYPDLRGTWTGTADQVARALDRSGGVFQSGAMTLVIDAQQDRRFYGGIDVVEGAARLKLDIVGVFTNQEEFRWAEPSGEVEGHMVDADTIEACYLRISAFSQVAACETLTRQ